MRVFPCAGGSPPPVTWFYSDANTYARLWTQSWSETREYTVATTGNQTRTFTAISTGSQTEREANGASTYQVGNYAGRTVSRFAEVDRKYGRTDGYTDHTTQINEQSPRDYHSSSSTEYDLSNGTTVPATISTISTKTIAWQTFSTQQGSEFFYSAKDTTEDYYDTTRSTVSFFETSKRLTISIGKSTTKKTSYSTTANATDTNETMARQYGTSYEAETSANEVLFVLRASSATKIGRRPFSQCARFTTATSVGPKYTTAFVPSINRTKKQSTATVREVKSTLTYDSVIYTKSTFTAINANAFPMDTLTYTNYGLTTVTSSSKLDQDESTFTYGGEVPDHMEFTDYYSIDPDVYDSWSVNVPDFPMNSTSSKEIEVLVPTTISSYLNGSTYRATAQAYTSTTVHDVFGLNREYSTTFETITNSDGSGLTRLLTRKSASYFNVLKSVGQSVWYGHYYQNGPARFVEMPIGAIINSNKGAFITSPHTVSGVSPYALDGKQAGLSTVMPLSSFYGLSIYSDSASIETTSTSTTFVAGVKGRTMRGNANLLVNIGDVYFEGGSIGQDATAIYTQASGMYAELLPQGAGQTIWRNGAVRTSTWGGYQIPTAYSFLEYVDETIEVNALMDQVGTIQYNDQKDFSFNSL